MLAFNNVTICLKKNNRPLIENFNFTLQKYDKIAIIGEEGNGKSTLLKLINNKNSVLSYVNVSGNIIINNEKIGYLEQILDSDWNNCFVIDYFLKSNPFDEINYDKYNLINLIYDLFSKLNLDKKLIEKNHYIGTLSGGEKVKLQLVKILLNNPDILLLDEPTNDLDIDTLIWLEKFISNTNIPLLFVSHDETLLEKCANGIIHIEQNKKLKKSKYTIERIKYSEYIDKRFNIISKQEQIAKKQRDEYKKQKEKYNEIYEKVKREQNNISRADPHGGRLLKKKMKSLKSQEKRYEREKEDFVDIPDVEESIIISNSNINPIPNGKLILDLYLDKLTVGKNILSKNITLNVTGPEHIVIIGKNGIGKSTLLNKIYEELRNRDDIKVGYIPQEYDKILDFNKSAIEFLSENCKDNDIDINTFMACLKFPYEEMNYKLGELSGGQRAKILVLYLILNKYNVILLDEPTRNLSPLSNPVIRNLLKNYKGVIISVSHDRKYIEEVCNKIYELNADGLFNLSKIC